MSILGVERKGKAPRGAACLVSLLRFRGFQHTPEREVIIGCLVETTSSFQPPCLCLPPIFPLRPSFLRGPFGTRGPGAPPPPRVLSEMVSPLLFPSGKLRRNEQGPGRPGDLVANLPLPCRSLEEKLSMNSTRGSRVRTPLNSRLRRNVGVLCHATHSASLPAGRPPVFPVRMLCCQFC